MSLKTKLLELFKYEPETDGAQTFNIKSALNDNWDRIEAWAQSVKTTLAGLVPTSRKVNGKALTGDVTLTGENIAVSSTDSTPISGAVKYRTNPNLLYNWYFANPANQRGQMKYTESWKYSIDRWLCAGDGKVTIADGHCVFYGAVDQGLSVQMSDIESKILTASLLFADGSLLSESAVDTNQSIDIPFWSNIKDTYCGLNSTDLSGHRRFRLYFNKNTPILAAKLELGDTQTLAHQDSSGNWILNEIPDFVEQLRRCMYYAEKIEDGNTPVITNATFIPAGATSATFVLPYERKRTSPSIRFNDVSNYRVIVRSMSGNTSAFGISNISILDVGTTKASVLVTFSSATSQDWYGYLQRADNTSGGYAFISADL